MLWEGDAGLDISELSVKIKNLVPVTVFNQGQASKFFSRVKKGESFVVLKNNVPISVILSVEEYALMKEAVNICRTATEKDEEVDKKRITALLAHLRQFDCEVEK